ncbi:MAG: hypothetical protein HKO53_15130 [Gemmatimonadetes bacterium]|nr:hypothetical protein [Gemmatimonadota bacterium]NNM34409.1 hypothetical protein [Gemmatimonadota bacterium]
MRTVAFALSVPLAALEVITIHSALQGRVASGALQGVVVFGIVVYALASRVRLPSAQRRFQAQIALLISTVAMGAVVLLHARLVSAQGASGPILQTAAFLGFQLGWAVTFWLSAARGQAHQNRFIPAAIGTVLLVGGGLVTTTGSLAGAEEEDVDFDPGRVVREMFVTPEDLGPAVESRRAGEDSGSAFAHFHTGGQPLRGLAVSVREWFGQERIDGEIAGIFEGEPVPEGAHLLQAKPGYVVSDVEVQADEYINALRVQFAPFEDGFVSPLDRYWSPWVGGHVRHGFATRLVESTAVKIIGLRASSGLVLNSLSLLIDAR